MNLTPLADNLRRECAAAADNGIAPPESAIRLALLDVLSAAADDLTLELAPGSVELRLRGGEPDFVVTPPPADRPAEDGPEPAPPPDLDDAATARINLRLPEPLKAAIEQAASRERLSVNAWLVRALSGAVAHDQRDRRPRPRGSIGQSFTGWAS